MTGTLRQPVSPANSTVLGYRVKADSVTWRGLDWSRGRTDNGPHAMHAEASGYLHVAYAHPEDKKDLWDGVSYRVRYDGWLGKRINVGGRYAWIVSIEPEEGPDGWQWVIGYGPRTEAGE